ncbi:hypothetical protein HNQ77_004123 [Silvibacterium bohemicum]|uniref:Uncharacterized protein n=1 Tax=Silvibacterium bohemicum TaxID=1577686 RepID=A0A841K4S9_9BACT|nr:hypothetical protein [Silvibacterium bohemicum]MBB6146151.1 hypothetical protein [Silvibacterium bohemicum]
MTLLDAPKYDAKKARLMRNLSIAGVSAVVIAAILFGMFMLNQPWWLWNWSADHRVNNFFTTIESGDLQKAYALWNNDTDWQQHASQYKDYDFNQFQKDWGVGSDYGKIRSHAIVMAKKVGNGTVMGVDINGGKTPIFLRVDQKTKTIGFSPVELYTGP